MSLHPGRFGLATVVLVVAWIALALVPLGHTPASAATSLPTNFQETVVFGGFDHPTAVEFSPDGRVFVAEQSGLIKVFDNLSDTTPTTFADLRTSVHNYWDRGLLGLELDPNFPADPYVYALYTYDYDPNFTGPQPPRWGDPGSTGDGCPDPLGDGCVVTGGLSRLEANGNTMIGSEDILVGDWCQQYPSHTVGTVAFGPDGALYVGAGDGASFQGVDYGGFGGSPNVCGDPPDEGGALRSQDLGSSSDPTGLDGSVIRIDPDTGQALPNNPLAGDPDSNARRIVSYGFRNPFRFTFRPGTNELWLGDVGWNDAEEINRIPSPTSGVSNFGWPCYEGTEHQSGYDGADLDLCEGLYAAPGAVTSPHFAYEHSEKVVAGETCPTGDSSLSGLAFYEGADYPNFYDGSLFFSDYSRDCIWVMPPEADGVPNPSAVDTFVVGAANPVEIEIGPGGDLFYVDFGERGGADPGSIRRIRYFSDNEPPTAVATTDPDPPQGAAPLTVEFDGAGSTDPDLPGDTLTYHWDLDGDGEFDDASGPAATRTYDEGTHTAALRVTDAEGFWDETDPITISAGNTSPAAVIDTPSSSTTWAAGDEITFLGHATDAQQGNLPDSALSWDLTLYHGGHAHPLQSWDGTAGDTFPAPGHDYPAYLELRLTAIDAGGLPDTETVRLDPKTVDLTFESNPSGLDLTVGSDTDTTPFTRTVIVGSTNTITAPSPQTGFGSTWEWVSWSDGGAATHEITAPDADATYTAVYQAVAAAAPNAAPSAVIDTPAPSTAWAVGESVAFSGHATDPQEGQLPASSMAWRLLLHDCSSCPARTLQTWPGTRSGSFIPPPTGPDAYLELELSATDGKGAVGMTTHRLDPQVVQVAVATKPAGLNARVASGPREVSATRSVVAGSKVKIRAPKFQRARGMKFRFRSWSDGGARIHDVVVGPGTPTLVAKYRCMPGPGQDRGDCRRVIKKMKRAAAQRS